MRIWPISMSVNKPENDDPSINEPIALVASVAWSHFPYVFGAVRVGIFTLVTLTALSA